MIAELGSFALVLALAFSLAQAGLSFAGRMRNSSALRGAGEGAAAAAFLCLLVAFGTMMAEFIRSDFSVMNVAQNSHTEKPLLYKIAGVWGSHEGSMLLWCLALTGYGCAVALTGKGLPARLKAVVVATQGALGSLFLAYTVFASNPFLRLDSPPVEGNSLNPALQDPAFAFHPPMLYAGYVGCSIVFSFAVAALVEGRVDAAWARWVRPWTLAAWGFLTLGITLGSFWAYYELGWGGWWAWDPVENASFMPWLIATALLHSAIVTEKRGALPGWTVFLALAAFTFSMLGAFLVRSGVLMSVHAFAVDAKCGILLLSILGIAAGCGFALFAWRAPKLAKGGVYAPVSRETALILNNIFLAAATATVMLGTLYPLIIEAITGKPISVGTGYFNRSFVPLMAAVLVILPAGPLLAWKRGDGGELLKRLTAPLAVALLAGLVTIFLTSPKSALATTAAMIGAWLIAGALTELAERVRLGRGSSAESLRRLTGLPRGSWGTTLAHIGMGVFVLGAGLEIAGKVEASKVMSVGDSLSVGAYVLTMTDVSDVDGPNYLAQRATMSAIKNGKLACSPAPERRLFYVGETSTSETAICLRGLDDLYVVMGEQRAGEGKKSWLVQAYVNPWVRLIFLGPVLMALGGVVSLSDRRLRLGVGRRRAPKPVKATGKVEGKSEEAIA
ncbi:heme lyase CcmF/NrfE family subunit [soil metagenome]